MFRVVFFLICSNRDWKWCQEKMAEKKSPQGCSFETKGREEMRITDKIEFFLEEINEAYTPLMKRLEKQMNKELSKGKPPSR